MLIGCLLLLITSLIKLTAGNFVHWDFPQDEGPLAATLAADDGTLHVYYQSPILRVKDSASQWKSIYTEDSIVWQDSGVFAAPDPPASYGSGVAYRDPVSLSSRRGGPPRYKVLLSQKVLRDEKLVNRGSNDGIRSITVSPTIVSPWNVRGATAVDAFSLQGYNFVAYLLNDECRWVYFVHDSNTTARNYFSRWKPPLDKAGSKCTSLNIKRIDNQKWILAITWLTAPQTGARAQYWVGDLHYDPQKQAITFVLEASFTKEKEFFFDEGIDAADFRLDRIGDKLKAVGYIPSKHITPYLRHDGSLTLVRDLTWANGLQQSPPDLTSLFVRNASTIEDLTITPKTCLKLPSRTDLYGRYAWLFNLMLEEGDASSGWEIQFGTGDWRDADRVTVGYNGTNLLLSCSHTRSSGCDEITSKALQGVRLNPLTIVLDSEILEVYASAKDTPTTVMTMSYSLDRDIVQTCILAKGRPGRLLAGTTWSQLDSIYRVASTTTSTTSIPWYTKSQTTTTTTTAVLTDAHRNALHWSSREKMGPVRATLATDDNAFHVYYGSPISEFGSKSLSELKVITSTDLLFWGDERVFAAISEQSQASYGSGAVFRNPSPAPRETIGETEYSVLVSRRLRKDTWLEKRGSADGLTSSEEESRRRWHLENVTTVDAFVLQDSNFIAYLRNEHCGTVYFAHNDGTEPKDLPDSWKTGLDTNSETCTNLNVQELDGGLWIIAMTRVFATERMSPRTQYWVGTLTYNAGKKGMLFEANPSTRGQDLFLDDGTDAAYFRLGRFTGQLESIGYVSRGPNNPYPAGLPNSLTLMRDLSWLNGLQQAPQNMVTMATYLKEIGADETLAAGFCRGISLIGTDEFRYVDIEEHRGSATSDGGWVFEFLFEEGDVSSGWEIQFSTDWRNYNAQKVKVVYDGTRLTMEQKGTRALGPQTSASRVLQGKRTGPVTIILDKAVIEMYVNVVNGPTTVMTMSYWTDTPFTEVCLVSIGGKLTRMLHGTRWYQVPSIWSFETTTTPRPYSIGMGYSRAHRTEDYGTYKTWGSATRTTEYTRRSGADRTQASTTRGVRPPRTRRAQTTNISTTQKAHFDEAGIFSPTRAQASTTRTTEPPRTHEGQDTSTSTTYRADTYTASRDTPSTARARASTTRTTRPPGPHSDHTTGESSAYQADTLTAEEVTTTPAETTTLSAKARTFTPRTTQPSRASTSLGPISSTHRHTSPNSAAHTPTTQIADASTGNSADASTIHPAHASPTHTADASTTDSADASSTHGAAASTSLRGGSPSPSRPDGDVKPFPLPSALSRGRYFWEYIFLNGQLSYDTVI